MLNVSASVREFLLQCSVLLKSAIEAGSRELKQDLLAASSKEGENLLDAGTASRRMFLLQFTSSCFSDQCC